MAIDANSADVTVADEEQPANRPTVAQDSETSCSASDHSEQPDAAGREKRGSGKFAIGRFRVVVLTGAAMVIMLGAVTGLLGFQFYEVHRDDEQRALFLQTARQGALNLTTIDYTRVDSDVGRILDSSIGQFHNDFQQRSAAFIAVVKQAQSRSQGTVTEAGLESVQGRGAHALIAISVNTSTPGSADQKPRLWRMRIAVETVGDAIKVSDVEFVP